MVFLGRKGYAQKGPRNPFPILLFMGIGTYNCNNQCDD